MHHTKEKRVIRSFVLRQGRLTKAQQYALNHYWVLYGIDTNNKILDFSQLFPQVAPVTLEIGFGNGESLVTMAQNAPEKNFIGIEVHSPGVGRLLHLIHAYQLSNLRIIQHDAVEVITHQIPEKSLACVQLFFPDPWHKKKHHKRRIVQTAFVKLIASRLKSQGIFHLATDWQDYAHQMAEVLEKSSNFNRLSDTPFSPKPSHRPLTKFEQRGLKLGHDIWDLLYYSL